MGRSGAIQFVNHASFVLEYQDVRLVCDPWIVGSAFQNGWDLLTTIKDPVDFSTITHIWFSHEHPDHFSVPSIKAIPAEFRSRITVLFQTTKDKKVINFCRSLGFKVQELPLGRVVSLTPSLFLTCAKEGIEDSWLYIETPEFRILNLNDCVIDSSYRAKKLRKAIGNNSPDILFSQFGYASKIGDEGDDDLRREESAAHLGRLAVQCEVLKPRIVVPFASFVYFSQSDNFYMNSGMNDIGDVEVFLKDKTTSRPIVMRPGQTVDIAQAVSDVEIDNSASVAFYRAAREAIRPKDPAPSNLDIADLTKAADAYRERLKRYLPIQRALHTVFPNVFRNNITFYLTGIDKFVVFDWRGPMVEVSPTQQYVRISPESLKFLFDFDFGAATLGVNGRYTNCNIPARAFRFMFIFGNWRNNGELFPVKYLAERLLEKLTGSRRVFEG